MNPSGKKSTSDMNILQHSNVQFGGVKPVSSDMHMVKENSWTLVSKGGINEDVTAMPVILKEGGAPSTLTLRNSFTLLPDECELPLGEAQLDDHSKDKPLDLPEFEKYASLESDCLEQIDSVKVPSKLKKRNPKIITLSSNTQLVQPGVENFNKPASPSLVLNLLDDEAIILVGESNHKIVLSPIKMVTPVTIYEELGPDKGKAMLLVAL